MRTFTILTICLFTLSLNAQKVKFKKGVVKIDNKESYKFEKIKKDNQIRPTIQMKNMSGDMLIEIKDNPINYEQLPSEKSPRMYEYMNTITFKDDEPITIPYFNRLNVSKALHKLLEDTDFYKGGELSPATKQSLLSKMEQEKVETAMSSLEEKNKARKINAAASEEKFGKLTEREPAKQIDLGNNEIRENGKLGKVSLKEKGSILSVYEISNNRGEIIAKMILNKSGSKKATGNILTLVDEVRKEFSYELTLTDNNFDPTEKRQAQMIQYLVDMGYL